MWRLFSSRNIQTQRPRPEGSGTYSHPWTASPALTVPRLLCGLAPAAGVGGDAWRQVEICPFPTSAVPRAWLSYPSPRGTFVVSAGAFFHL
jgi:hypothetical protein